MTSIVDILFEDVKIFLDKNNIVIPPHEYEAYDIVLDLIKNYDKNIYYTDAIINWMKARNYLLLELRIPYYTKNEIYCLPYIKLNDLKILLEEDKIDNIINILYYMGKLKPTNLRDQLFNISNMNDDIFIEIFKNMNLDTIENICYTSKQFYNFCQTKSVFDIVKTKLPNNFNFINFTLKQLFFYGKVHELRKKIIIEGNVHINLHDKLFTIEHDRIKELTIKNSIQIIPYKYIPTKYSVLYNDGRCDEISHMKDEIIAIEKNGECITVNGEYYDRAMTRISNFLNIIQKSSYLILTDKGEVYLGKNPHKNIKILTPDIISLGENNHMLSKSGDVYKYNKPHLIKLPTVPNIKQITSYKESSLECIAYLDENGNVFINKQITSTTKEILVPYSIPHKICKLSNIIEIALGIIDKNLRLITLNKYNVVYIVNDPLGKQIITPYYLNNILSRTTY